MTDYNTPETALLDLDWLIEQASLFITPNAIATELEGRVRDIHTKVSGSPGSFRPLPAEAFSAGMRGGLDKAYGLPGPAPAAMDDTLRRELRRFLAHESVEDVYDPYLDRMGKLELACRKAEVDRRLSRMITEVASRMSRQAA